MVFKELNILDYDKYTKFFESNELYKDYYGAELNFKVIFLWKHYQKLENYISNNYVIIKGQTKHHTFFLPPLANSKKAFYNGIEDIKNYCKEFNLPIIIKYLNKTLKDELLKNCSVKEIAADRNAFEYIYLTEEIIKYEGKKFHDKKNHLHQFERYGFVVKDYEDKYYDKVLDVLDYWNKHHGTSEFEDEAIKFSLKYYNELNIKCELYTLDDKPCAFVIGTICENNMGVLLFEKADVSFKGIYAGINNCFVKNNFAGCKYVNMQEDMGDIGLRKSKTSYNPVFFEEKYNVILNQNEKL